MNRFGHTNCIECKRPHRREHNAWRCWACEKAFAPVKGSAISQVARAVARSEMPRADSLMCVDCGSPAHHYDHRDYRRPLDVVPVCRSCNHKRGPALWRDVPSLTAQAA